MRVYQLVQVLAFWPLLPQGQARSLQGSEQVVLAPGKGGEVADFVEFINTAPPCARCQVGEIPIRHAV